MSLILDALNRSDSDRSGSADTPGLHSVHGPRGDESSPAWRRFLWPGLTLVFAAIAGLIWWEGGSEPQAPPVVRAEPTAAPRPAPVATPAEVRPAVAAQPRPQARREIPRESMAQLPRPAPGFSDDVAALYSQMQAAGVDPNEPVAPPPSEPARPRLSSQMAAESLAELEQMAQAAEPARPEPVEEAAPAPQAQAYDVEALARAAQAELDNRPRRNDPPVQHEAPFITDLRQSQKDQIPSIFYNQHNWSSDPARRSVILNGQERREGQQVKPGLRLVEILETSIVLNFNGTEFQLRSLNSWVNL
ncbi:MAG: general secretion pathway protein GspB [Halieaceae bacterium]|nr:general secretion pathway protein GspB [Halieaceae bacterium]